MLTDIVSLAEYRKNQHLIALGFPVTEAEHLRQLEAFANDEVFRRSAEEFAKHEKKARLRAGRIPIDHIPVHSHGQITWEPR